MNFGEFRVVFLPVGDSVLPVRERGFLFVTAHGVLRRLVLEGAPVDETVIDKSAGFQSRIELTALGFRWEEAIFVDTVCAHVIITPQ